MSNLNEPMSPPASPRISRHQTALSYLLICQICFNRALDAKMCPNCSKLFCESCLMKYGKDECASCRQIVKNGMTKCGRFVDELEEIVEGLIQVRMAEEVCKEHNIQINYFCEDCSVAACCECNMFGKHQGHSFRKLSEIHSLKSAHLRKLLLSLKSNLQEKGLLLSTLGESLQALRKSKQAQEKEMEEYIEKGIRILNEENEIKEKSEQEGKMLVGEIQIVEEQLKRMLNNGKKNHNFWLPPQTQTKISKIMSHRLLSKSESHLQLLPPFHSTSFSFSTSLCFKQSQKQKPIYSPVTTFQFSEWRLKIYPRGNGLAPGWMSALVQLVRGKPVTIQYRIQATSKKGCVSKEGTGSLSPGQSSGFSKFIQITDLPQQQLNITYSIRLQSYYDVWKLRKARNQHIDDQIQKQEQQIAQLQKKIQSKQ